jgi:hypothetical protein
MTNRELDAFIAEHVMGQTVKAGWAYMSEGEWHVTSGPYGSGNNYVEWTRPQPVWQEGPGWEIVAFYSTNLNACARAEAKIAELGLAWEYVVTLLCGLFPENPTVNNSPDNIKGAWWVKHAMYSTARQRCDAMYLMREHIEQARAAPKDSRPRSEA